MHTLTENVKRGSTAHTQYTSKKKKKKKLQPQTTREQKILGERTRVQSIDKSQSKNMKGDRNVKHKRNMITQHQPHKEKKKKKTFLVNRHVPQTPPHVYQINLVILLS